VAVTAVWRGPLSSTITIHYTRVCLGDCWQAKLAVCRPSWGQDRAAMEWPWTVRRLYDLTHERISHPVLSEASASQNRAAREAVKLPNRTFALGQRACTEQHSLEQGCRAAEVNGSSCSRPEAELPQSSRAKQA
jgi:hypothetical protein